VADATPPSARFRREETRIDRHTLTCKSSSIPPSVGRRRDLIRIEQNVEAQEEAYEKLDQAISTTRLSDLQTSFSPMERRAMLRAAVKIAH